MTPAENPNEAHKKWELERFWNMLNRPPIPVESPAISVSNNAVMTVTGFIAKPYPIWRAYVNANCSTRLTLDAHRLTIGHGIYPRLDKGMDGLGVHRIIDEILGLASDTFNDGVSMIGDAVTNIHGLSQAAH